MRRGVSMTEATSAPQANDSAGAILRAAREKQGMHVAALAASMKITVAKLEALEGDRFDELPDATFTRALALTVCRALKIDPAPVLARLPQGGPIGLGRVTGGLNTPFRERPGRSEPNDFSLKRRPLIWLALFVLLAALVVFFLPTRLQRGTSLSTSEPAASAAALEVLPAPEAAASANAVVPQAAASAAEQPAVEVVHSVPVDADMAASQPAAAAPALVVRAQSASWVEVVDSSGQVLLSRTLQPGERVAIDGSTPFRLKIGNAAATQLVFRGAPVDLTPSIVGNVARLELR